MNQKNKTFQREFNNLNKNHSLILVNKRNYRVYKAITIIVLIIFFLATISIVIAQEKIDFKDGTFIIKVEHTVSQDTLEGLVRYIDFVLNKENPN